ncbi:EAL domain-containing protein [Gemmobacter denitrificans]|uniref:EAL domain-containing protein n=1 Tax=Gemmobacter denitrificans TaxID=3123040 RepID=A0ABU8BVB0_9RHOB
MADRGQRRGGEVAGSPLAFVISEQDRETIAMVEHALREKRVRLAYQPVVLGTDPTRAAFYEGLIRVLDETGRVIPARDFMGAVENQEIGRLIDCAALELGLQTLARHTDIRLSINMSARSIGYPRWMRVLKKGLQVSPTIGERLILEITESSAILVPEIVTAFMDDLQREGIAFALDDFGAGYTAFRYFKDFFFDILKIDGQFIRGIDRDPDNQVLTRALMSIARQFEMFCVAESVETAEEAAFLQSIGIDCMQGYLFGAPTLRPAFMPEPERKRA